ncbi:MAG: carboxypeptidase-like regulatory domain-containing protein [Acidobacteriota bacterium]|nr:carboxypeptidase-like regulatory domain-containing protein [Acidobacteriota bacterium]
MTQSGRSGMRGYVAFEDLSYNEVAERKVHARIELRRTARDKDVVSTETDEHGSYDFHSVSPGEYVLRISSPGYRVYETEIYLPSDFIGNLAVMLKKEKH